MPHFREAHLNDYMIQLRPNDKIRRIIRGCSWDNIEIPYFYGTHIYLDMKVRTKKIKKIKDKIEYSWNLFQVGKEEVLLGGKDEFNISEKMSKNRLFALKNGWYVFRHNYIFIKKMAIEIGTLSELERYKIIINMADERGNKSSNNIVAEFTLQDRDNFYAGVANLLLGAIFGAIFGLIFSIIAIVFT